MGSMLYSLTMVSVCVNVRDFTIVSRTPGTLRAALI